MGSIVAELAEKLTSATNSFDIDEQTLYVNTAADTVGIGTNSPDGKLSVHQSGTGDIFNLYDGTTNILTVVDGGALTHKGAITVGVDDTGHDVKFFGATSGKYMLWDESADSLIVDGKVGIGTSAPQTLTHINKSSTTSFSAGNASWHDLLISNGGTATDHAAGIVFIVSSTGTGYNANAGTGIAAVKNGDSSDYGADMVFITRPQSAAAEERMRITDDGNVGIGTTSPSESLTNRGNIFIETNSTSADSGGGLFWHSTTSGWSTTSAHAAIYGKRTDASNGYLRFDTRQSGTTQEAMRINSSGQLLIGKTTNSITTAGTAISSILGVRAAVDGNIGLLINRLTDDGNLIDLRQDDTTVGTIGSTSADALYIATPKGSDSGIRFDSTYIAPATTTGSNRDDALNWGYSSSRWDNIYATNGTIETSDRNEKQDIEELSEAEQRVAVVAKGLLRKFRWKSAVDKKGDGARIHFGIIAQDLKTAFEAEGLDAGRYGMFIHSEWWESEETYTDDDGVEKTRINTYDTEEEAPEGAIKKDRMGVRYSELLSFIISAI